MPDEEAAPAQMNDRTFPTLCFEANSNGRNAPAIYRIMEILNKFTTIYQWDSSILKWKESIICPAKLFLYTAADDQW
jgi:hypothetical protein